MAADSPELSETYTVDGLETVTHMSHDDTSGVMYYGDGRGTIVYRNTEGFFPIPDLFPDKNDYFVHHTVRDGILYYTFWNGQTSGIMRKDLGNCTDFTIRDPDQNKDGNPDPWKPISIHASHFNDDILVGMTRGSQGSVVRCDSKGNVRIRLRFGNNGQLLYKSPNYITVRSNGDVCASDTGKQAVIVVDPLNQMNTNFRGLQDQGMNPTGICADTSGGIIVCDGKKVLLYERGTWRDLLQEEDGS